MKRIEDWRSSDRIKRPPIIVPDFVIVKTPDCGGGGAAARDWTTTSINTLSTFQLGMARKTYENTKTYQSKVCEGFKPRLIFNNVFKCVHNLECWNLEDFCFCV